MLMKVVKIGAIATAGFVLVGGLLFGGDLLSYVSSSTASMREAVRESVPIEVELQRARHTLEEIVPEIQANVRLIAKEEVEIEALKDDIARSKLALVDEKARIAKLSSLLTSEQVAYTLGGRTYSRDAVKDDLARRFDGYKEAEVVLAGKERLLTAREQSLSSAIALLDKARSRKEVLASKIEQLVSQHRLVTAAAVGSQIQVDNSKLAQTEKLIGQIKKRLDVAERVLAHEGRFVEPIEVDVIDEQDLLTQIHEHFGGADQQRLTDATD